MPVLGQGVRGVAQKGHDAAFARQQGLAVCARNVRCVRMFLAPEIDLGFAPLIRSGSLVRAVACDHALVRGPSPQQRAINAEMLVGHQLGRFGNRHNAAEEPLAHHAFLEQALAVGRERRVIPVRLVQRQPDEPAVHHVEVDMFDQRTFRADRKQALQQRGAQQPLRLNRGTSAFGIERIEMRRPRTQNEIGERLHATQRMVSGNSILDIDVAGQGLCLWSSPRIGTIGEVMQIVL